MTDQTLPSSGGAYIRLADGSLQLEEPPTADGYRLAARAAAAKADPEAAVEGAVEGAFEATAAPPADPAPRSPVKRTGKDA